MRPITSHRFDSALRAELKGNLDRFERRVATGPDLIDAAVAITVYPETAATAAVIVTRRSPRLNDHAGQWALPGGRLDGPETAIDAARRELDEEVALGVAESAVLGLLDDYVTRSGYRITPVVIWSDTARSALVPDPGEVASIHPFDFTELDRGDSPNLERIAESDREVLSMNYGDDVIYAPTAALLYQFREVAMNGRSTRVAHFDQPVFAWR